MGIWPSPGTADGRPHRPVRPMAPRGSSAAALGTSRSTTVSTASHRPATWAALVGERSSEVQWSLRESEHARVRAPQKHTLLRTLRQSLQTGISSCHRRRKRVTSAAAWLPLVCFQVVRGGGRVLRDPKDCDWPTYSSEYLGASAWLRTWSQMYPAILAHPSPAFRVPHCFYVLKDNFTHCTASKKAKYHCKLL